MSLEISSLNKTLTINPRVYFNAKILDKDKIKQTIYSYKLLEPEILNTYKQFKLPLVDSTSIVVSSPEIPMFLLYKYSKEILQNIYFYNHSHLKSSIIKELLHRTTYSTNYMDPAQNAVMILYYWNFFQNITGNLCNSVIIDLEDIIATIIKKENTLYKLYKTDPILEALQFKKTAIKIMLDNSKKPNINFRR